MALQNRVMPTGEIIADPARSLFMGNRGVLHDDRRRLGPARWKHKNWVTCRLQFNNRQRTLMTPNRYTELFFLDEAVALAAGHRPCGECRRADYNRYLDRWTHTYGARPDAKALDTHLHAERAEPGARRNRCHSVIVEDVPDGAFIHLGDGTPCLVRDDRIHPYTPSGYGMAQARPTGPAVMLTPPVTAEILRAGYRPVLHPSIDSDGASSSLTAMPSNSGDTAG